MTSIQIAVNAAFDWAQKNGKTFDAEKIGLKLRELYPPEDQKITLETNEAQKRGIAAAQAVL